MHSLLLLILTCGEPAGVTPCPAETVACVAAGLKTGDLIFSRGDCLAVRVFSGSPYTHVAGIVVRNGQATVYDSMNGVGVRKTPLSDYLGLQTPSQIQVVRLVRPLTVRESTAFEAYLDSQLGRPYAIRHHLTGDRGDGVHCAEYMTDALMAARRIHADRPARVSPGSLREGLTEGGVCVAGVEVDLPEQVVPEPAGTTWCQRTWNGTVSCCRSCGAQVRRWVLCR